MKSNLVIFTLVILLTTGLIAQEEQTFLLKSGDRITGTIVSINDSTGVYVIQTGFGQVTINKEQIIPPSATILLKNGNKLSGELIEESEEAVRIKAAFGEVSIDRAKIDKIYFKKVNLDQEDSIPGESEAGPWYYGRERLIDIFFDPTGYVLERNVLYLSGLSWGYGITDRLQITSKWIGYFKGDLNLRPKLMLFRRGDYQTESTFSIGGHFHSRSQPDKYIYNKSEFGDRIWEQVGDDGSDYGDEIWYELFMAYTVSNLRETGQGRLTYTAGASATIYPGYDPFPRVYGAIAADVRRNLSLVMEVFYDPYWPSFMELNNDEPLQTKVNLDFGFVYATSESFRLGLHFHRPFILFYHKF